MNERAAIVRAAAETSDLATPAPRDSSLDLARGLIVALMALDHVRMYFSAAQFDPVDLDHTNIAYFLTRWITHLCAPGFFFLAGLGAGLFEAQAGRRAASRFLLTRGAMLIAMEILVFGLAWSFNPGWWWFGVIWGLGAAMVAMAALVYVPRAWLFVAALLFTVLHNSLWGDLTALAPAADALLYSGGMATLPGIGERVVVYPVLPWLVLMALGFAATPWLSRGGDPGGRRRLAVGALALALFMIVRLLGFGQPAGGGFIAGNDFGRTLMAWLNVEKYPPSLQYSLATLGIGILVVGLARRFPLLVQAGAMQPLVTFGRVPLLFYQLHLFVIHGAAWGVATLFGWPRDYLVWSGAGPNLIPPDGYGFGLAEVYAAWAIVLAVLLPPCVAFARVKRSSANSWLRLL